MIEYFVGHLDLISYLFNQKMSHVGDLKMRDLQQKLAFINSILTVTFDMKIVRDRFDRDIWRFWHFGSR